MSVDLATFRARAPQFADLDDAVMQSCIDESAAQHEPMSWGASLETAVLYKAMAFAELQQRAGQGAAGPTTSMTAGPMSRTFAAPQGAAEDALAGTTGGQLWNALASTRLNLTPLLVAV